MILKKNQFYLAFVALSLMFACTDDGLVGDIVRPDRDQLGVYQINSIPLEVNTFIPDTLQTDGQSDYLLGGFWHPKFGTATASMGMQFRYDELLISKEKVAADEVIIDDAFLYLIFRNYFGDSLSVNEVNVYELNKEIDNYTDYYANENPSEYYNESDLLGTAMFTAYDADELDSIRQLSDYSYRVKVPLNTSFVDKLLDNFDEASSSVAGFQNIFKGLYIKPTLGNSTLLSIPAELTSTLSSTSVVDFSSIQLLYHYPNDSTHTQYTTSVPDSTELEDGSYAQTPIITVHDTTYLDTVRIQPFIFNTECGRFNHFSFETEGTDVAESLNNPSSDKLYIRGMGGASLRVKLPDFANHPDLQALPGEDSTRIAINSAKLTFTVNTSDVGEYITDYSYFQKLVIRRDSLGSIKRVFDDNTQFTDGYIGGLLDEDNNSYYFNVTEQVQHFLNNPSELQDLIIQPVSNASNPFYTIVNGTNASENPFKLEIIYSRY